MADRNLDAVNVRESVGYLEWCRSLFIAATIAEKLRDHSHFNLYKEDVYRSVAIVCLDNKLFSDLDSSINCMKVGGYFGVFISAYGLSLNDLPRGSIVLDKEDKELLEGVNNSDYFSISGSEIGFSIDGERVQFNTGDIDRGSQWDSLLDIRCLNGGANKLMNIISSLKPNIEKGEVFNLPSSATRKIGSSLFEISAEISALYYLLDPTGDKSADLDMLNGIVLALHRDRVEFIGGGNKQYSGAIFKILNYNTQEVVGLSLNGDHDKEEHGLNTRLSTILDSVLKFDNGKRFSRGYCYILLKIYLAINESGQGEIPVGKLKEYLTVETDYIRKSIDGIRWDEGKEFIKQLETGVITINFDSINYDLKWLSIVLSSTGSLSEKGLDLIGRHITEFRSVDRVVFGSDIVNDGKKYTKILLNHLPKAKKISLVISIYYFALSCFDIDHEKAISSLKCVVEKAYDSTVTPTLNGFKASLKQSSIDEGEFLTWAKSNTDKIKHYLAFILYTRFRVFESLDSAFKCVDSIDISQPNWQSDLLAAFDGKISTKSQPATSKAKRKNALTHSENPETIKGSNGMSFDKNQFVASFEKNSRYLSGLVSADLTASLVQKYVQDQSQILNELYGRLSFIVNGKRYKEKEIFDQLNGINLPSFQGGSKFVDCLMLIVSARYKRLENILEKGDSEFGDQKAALYKSCIHQISLLEESRPNLAIVNKILLMIQYNMSADNPKLHIDLAHEELVS